MNNSTLESVISKNINKLYSLAYAIVPGELEAEQLVIDAYTRFILNDKSFILETELADPADEGIFLEFTLRRIIQEMVELAKKRTGRFSQNLSVDEFNAFYNLSFKARLIIHLNTVLGMDEEDMAKTLLIPKHEIIKDMYLAKNELLAIKVTYADR